MVVAFLFVIVVIVSPILVLAVVHDVAVVDVTPSKTVVGQNYSMLINVTVENQGDSSETFNVTAYYGNETLTPEQWETFWSMGDVNRDGYINDIDASLIAAYPSPTQCPWADLNQDGVVDVLDLMIVSINYGKDIWAQFISGAVIETQPVNNLSPGSSNTLTLTWNTTGVPYDNYTISAYAVPILCVEKERADNNYGDGIVLVSIAGDIWGDPDDPDPSIPDCDVDRYDYARFALAYGYCYPHPKYDSNADLNGDGCINRYDFSILALNYGQSV